MRFHPLVIDALVVTALMTVAVLLGQESTAQGWPALDAYGYLLVVLVNLPLAARNRAPLAVGLTVDVVWLVYITAGYWPVVNSFGPMLALYTIAATRATRTAGWCAVLMAAVWIYAGLHHEGSAMPSVIAQAVGFAAVLWRLGYLAGHSARLAQQLRREQAERAQREIARERGRIARELHDVIAHHMSVISVQAGLAGFVIDTDPATARGALRTISVTSAEALEELRRMLLVLRTVRADGAPAAPMPGLDRIGELVERVRSGGIIVVLRTEGISRPLASGVELCVYRVVQEALTNVLKHAPAARVEVTLRYGRDHLSVAVVDDGTGTIRNTTFAGGGHGLIGMRERVELYSGTIEIGPRSEGGFAVELTIPTSAPVTRRGADTGR